jgi:hypothetical protein
MDNVFVVVYQEYSMDVFEVLEVFKTRANAEVYIQNFPLNERYMVDNFFVLEKKLFN